MYSCFVNTAFIKKTAFLRIVSAFLCFLMVFSLFGVLPIVSSAGATTIVEVKGATGFDFTDNTYVAQKISEIFNLLPYSDYPYFTTWGYKSCDNSACTNCCVREVSKSHPNLKDLGIVDDYGAYSCFGFARWAFLYIYGIQANGLNYYGNTNASSNLQRIGRLAKTPSSSFVGEYDDYSLSTLKALFSLATAGDIIQSRSNKNDSNHTMIFLSCDENGFYILHNNAFKKKLGSDGKAYGYNRTLVTYYTYADFMSTYESFVSLLRAKQSVYENVWKNTIPLCAEHTYTKESCGVCTVCGYKFQNVNFSEAIGLYKLKESSKLLSSPYEQSASLSTLEKDSLVAINAGVINAFKEVYFRTVDNRYINALDLEKVEKGNGTITISPSTYPSGNVAYGKSFDLSGSVVASEGTISLVYGQLISNGGIVRQSAVESPNKATFAIYSSDVNYNLKFASLAVGEYYYLVAAISSNGDVEMFISEFSMTSSTRTAAETPSAPTLQSKSAYTITVVSQSGMEYSLDNLTWQTSNVFSNLSANTEYSVYRRVAETAAYYASKASDPLIVLTDYDTALPSPQPNLANITPYGVVFESDERLEYRVNAGQWQDSCVFTNLTSGATYFFSARVKTEDNSGIESEYVMITLPRAQNDQVPSAPSLDFATDTTITLVAAAGVEFSIDGGENYQKSTFFEGLSPAKDYSIIARYCQTDSQNASSPSEALIVTTLKSNRKAPTTIEAEEIGAYSVKIKAQDGVEYRIDGAEWQDSNEFSDLAPVCRYLIEMRYKESTSCYASEPVFLEITTDKYMPEAPGAPIIVEKSSDSVILGMQEDDGVGVYEFCVTIDGVKGEWQSSGLFENLKAYCELEFKARIAESDKSYASDESESVICMLYSKNITLEKYSYDSERGIMKDIPLLTSVSELLSNIREGKYFKAFDQNGKEITDYSQKVGSGMRFCILSSEGEEGEKNKEIVSFCTLVLGDLNGDGEITLADMIAVKAKTLSGEVVSEDESDLAILASDMNCDKKITIADFISVKAYVLGKN